MAKALSNPEKPIVTLTDQVLEQGKSASRISPRLRIMQPIQRDQNAQVQRLLNFLQPGTYIHPHRHPLAHATDSILLINGLLDVLIFSPEGQIEQRYRLTPSQPLIDLEPGIWHTIIPQAPDTVIFEVKNGPYNPETDKDFARWAPKEGSQEVDSYLQKITELD